MGYLDVINYLKELFDLSDFFERLFADEEKKSYLDNVPQFCKECELLGICRDKNNNWKCHHGCMILNYKK